MTRAEELQAWAANLPWVRRLAVLARAEAILNVRGVRHRQPVGLLVSAARPYVLALAGTAQYPTAVSVARAVGLSRERVRQILRRAGRQEYRRRGPPPGPAPLCECGQPRTCGALLCPACQHALHWPVLVCETCGRRFERRASAARAARQRGYQHIWCSRRCQGVGRRHQETPA